MLTDKMVQNAKPSEKRYELKDDHGLVLDILTSGVKAWRYRYSYKSKDYKLTLGEYPLISLKDARALRDEARLKKLRGENPARSIKALLTFGELFEQFQKTKLQEQSGEYIKHYVERVKNHIFPLYKDTPVRLYSSQSPCIQPPP